MYMQQRINALVQIGNWILNEKDVLTPIVKKAGIENPWFTEEFCHISLRNIAVHFLDKKKLEAWICNYNLQEPNTIKNIGIVMAGNIPAVGFYDWMCVFLSGHRAIIKPSSKDTILIKALVRELEKFYPGNHTEFKERISGCDAYIATGSNNSSRYFEYYFGKFPSIIRKNRSSVGILDGSETEAQLDFLADDMLTYFGLGCRNVTQIYTPSQYDFEPLIRTLRKYNYLAENYRYKNNYDYQLAIIILNKQYFMSTEAILLTEKDGIFAPISQAHYSFYSDVNLLTNALQNNEHIQCICGNNFIPFGKAQEPQLQDYADGVDVMLWLSGLCK